MASLSTNPSIGEFVELKNIVAGTYADLDTLSETAKNDRHVLRATTHFQQAQVLFDVARTRFGFVEDLSSEAAALVEATDTEPTSIRLTRGQRARLENAARLLSRLKDAAGYSWVLFCILILSAHFRSAVSTLSDTDWLQLISVFQRNQPSLELFSKIRGLSYWTMVDSNSAFAFSFRLHLRSLGNTKEMLESIESASPHDYVVPGAWRGKGSLVRSSGYLGRVDVESNFYKLSDWIGHPRPENWPSEWAYPKDPTVRRRGTRCSGCLSKRHGCGCSPKENILKPLAEIYNYGKKGVGIRSLARIPQDQHINEYVGRVLPLQKDPNQASDYSFELDVGVGEERQVVGVIDSEHEGNYLRYCNHSCDPNCIFEFCNFGNNLNVLVTALRPIDLYEELTVSCGSEYFTSEPYLLCKCGSEQCAFRSIKQIKAHKAQEDNDSIGTNHANYSTVFESSSLGYQAPNQARKVRPRKAKIDNGIWKDVLGSPFTINLRISYYHVTIIVAFLLLSLALVCCSDLERVTMASQYVREKLGSTYKYAHTTTSVITHSLSQSLTTANHFTRHRLGSIYQLVQNAVEEISQFSARSDTTIFGTTKAVLQAIYQFLTLPATTMLEMSIPTRSEATALGLAKAALQIIVQVSILCYITTLELTAPIRKVIRLF